MDVVVRKVDQVMQDPWLIADVLVAACVVCQTSQWAYHGIQDLFDGYGILWKILLVHVVTPAVQLLHHLLQADTRTWQ